MTSDPSVRLLVQTLEDVPAHDRWLSPQETAVLELLRFAPRRADWRLGRWTAKRALSSVLPPGVAVTIAASDDGAPDAFVEGVRLPFRISISHREGVAACAVVPSDIDMGCDLETIEPRTDGFVDDVFTPAERRALRAAPREAQALLVALGWSAKESVLKGLRVGLRSDTRSVEVDLSGVHGGLPGPSEGWAKIGAGEDSGRAFSGWWRREGTLVLTVLSDPPCASVLEVGSRGPLMARAGR